LTEQSTDECHGQETYSRLRMLLLVGIVEALWVPYLMVFLLIKPTCTRTYED
jgi:hypothetical protein